MAYSRMRTRFRSAGIPRSTFIPVDSPVHRLPAGVKAVGLVLTLLLTALLIRNLVGATFFLVVVLAAFGLARIPWRLAVLNLSTPLPVLLVLGGVMWRTTGFQEAATRFVVLFAAVSLAILLTLTTRVSDMMDAVERGLLPLARFGFPVEAVTLALSLTMRLIPLQLQLLHEVLDARKARGSGASIVAFGVPIIIRTLLRARALGEALVSRGVGD